MSRETLRCCLNLIDTLHSFHRDNHRFLIDACYNVHPTLTHNTSCHLFGVFHWKGGGGGVRRTSYSRHSSISFRSRQKNNLGVMILTGEVYFGLIITTRSSHSCVFFPNKIELNHQKYNSVIFYHLGGGTKRRGKNDLFCFEISLSVTVVF